jgi:hypothetical protein
MRSMCIEKTRPTVPVIKGFDHTWVSYDRSNIVAESGLPLGCAHIGGKSTYAISCVSPTAACPTDPLSVAYALYLRDRRISVHIARCAPVTRFLYKARRLFERACRMGAGAITPSTHARQCSNSPLAVVGAFHFARKGIAWDFRNLSIKSTHDYIFYLRRCEFLSGLLWRSVYMHHHNTLQGRVCWAQVLYPKP